MRAYSVFDDITIEAKHVLENAGVTLTVHPRGVERPSGKELKKILNENDVILISTAQIIDFNMFESIETKRIIGTLSIGTDHIHIPKEKQQLITIVNAPVSNRISVVEHIFGMILFLEKHLLNASAVSALGLNKTYMISKSQDLFGKTIGIIGTGGIGLLAIKYAKAFGLNIVCYSNDSYQRKREIGERFLKIDELLSCSDIVLISLPLSDSTRCFFDKNLINKMKDNGTLISISHSGVVDVKAAINRAHDIASFKVGIDVDPNEIYPDYRGNEDNVIITPHIAGGTIEARKRMFLELCNNISNELKKTR